MAYVTEVRRSRRMATLGAVAALHGGVALALLTTFAGGVVIQEIRKRLPAQQWTMPPQPQPVAPSSAKPSVAPREHARIVAPRPTLDLGLRPTAIETTTDAPPLQPVASDLIVPPLAQPSPAPTARFKPQAPAPRGNPGLWVGPRDYPAGALRRNEQGTTAFRVSIGTDGRVRDCTVTRSSGSADLDAATCAKVGERARFRPATGADGATVAGTWSSAVQWVIPD